MDARVEALIDELSSAGHLHPVATRERILQLFDEVRDEPSRVSMLHLFDAAMSIWLKHAVLADKRLFAIREATPDGANFDRAMLAHLVARDRRRPDGSGELLRTCARRCEGAGQTERWAAPQTGLLGDMFGRGR